MKNQILGDNLYKNNYFNNLNILMGKEGIFFVEVQRKFLHYKKIINLNLVDWLSIMFLKVYSLACTYTTHISIQS